MGLIPLCQCIVLAEQSSVGLVAGLVRNLMVDVDVMAYRGLILSAPPFLLPASVSIGGVQVAFV